MILCNVCMTNMGKDICNECSTLTLQEQSFVRMATWNYNKTYLKGKLSGVKPAQRFHFACIKNKQVIEAIIR